MSAKIDLTKLTFEELVELKTEIVLELRRRRGEPTVKRVRLLARERDLNAAGRGSEEYRKIAIPDKDGSYGKAEWLSDFGTRVADSWTQRGTRAAQRRCQTVVEAEVPIGPNGALVISINKRIGYGSNRPPVINAGFLPEKPEQEGLTEPLWGEGIESVGSKRVGSDWVTVVRLKDGRVLEV